MEAGQPTNPLPDPEEIRRRLAEFDVAHQAIDRPTPCLVVDEAAFDHNVATMAAALPGSRLRPHVKAFKSTALARRLHRAGHHSFTCATLAEVGGMLRADLGQDLLLANQTLDVDHLRRLTQTVRPNQMVTVAVDSSETIAAAVAGDVTHVLIDVYVGLPRCGCPPDEAGALAAEARRSGLEVRGVMGYEGHVMMVADPTDKAAQVEAAVATLAAAADDVGGDIISAGGTGTYRLYAAAAPTTAGTDRSSDTRGSTTTPTNPASGVSRVTEVQAGSYTLMDTDYARLDLPFRPALWVEATIISRNPSGWLVADAGLKAFGMDHGNPIWPFGDVWFCSDEHTTLWPDSDTARRWSVGDRVRLAPAHVDPTVAKHERMWLAAADGHTVIDEWPVDLRGW